MITAKPGYWIMTEFSGLPVLNWGGIFFSPKHPGLSTARARILVCGVCGISGVDNTMRAGGYTRVPRTPHPGFAPEYEIVGIVDEFGDQNRNNGFKTGDVSGSAIYAIVPLDRMFKLRPADNLVKAFALPLNYTTAFGMLLERPKKSVQK
ncbi:uncharacterized protein Z518_05543 [Rhinocladiella mackenziei CBS 650.93]|uniref:Uncharacterized protein n=1 Tax=Rhinocladiella mackenziei CBS 650.93 TaxID=1442369 RepID=A0A0D2H2L1_9EURO|nr:uncharacterized protein Z518_05543 [Rhinocladiella mackenziei CBS 650.93]KIX04673.1 hypothetical protein Z518_05543 [Rhinocladiella mackenziei CBS 650.93]